MINIHLPVWMNKGEVKKIARAFTRYWQQVNDWIRWPLTQIDPLTCSEILLNLLAYQRDISRFEGEPLDLFRLRVKYAFINAQDAGNVAGFAAIFKRLGIGDIEQLERQDNYDWDVIIIRVTDSQIAQNNTLIMSLVRQYGRTCRRYIFQVINNKSLNISGSYFGCNYYYHSAYIDIKAGIVIATQPTKRNTFNHQSTVYTASL